MGKTCADCVYFSCALFVCFHPKNEGRRAFPDTPGCGKHRTELNEQEEKEFKNQLFNQE